jgi:hypothetical protein
MLLLSSTCNAAHRGKGGFQVGRARDTCCAKWQLSASRRLKIDTVAVVGNGANRNSTTPLQTCCGNHVVGRGATSDCHCAVDCAIGSARRRVSSDTSMCWAIDQAAVSGLQLTQWHRMQSNVLLDSVEVMPTMVDVVIDKPPLVCDADIAAAVQLVANAERPLLIGGKGAGMPLGLHCNATPCDV